jgi:hypothetical protein
MTHNCKGIQEFYQYYQTNILIKFQFTHYSRIKTIDLSFDQIKFCRQIRTKADVLNRHLGKEAPLGASS